MNAGRAPEGAPSPMESLGAAVSLAQIDRSRGEAWLSERLLDELRLGPAVARMDLAAFRKRVHPDDRVRYDALIAGARRHVADIRLHREDDGYLHYQAQAVRVGAGVDAAADPLVFLMNVTDVVEKGAEILRAAELQARAREMEMFAKIAGGVAHDFNNLLAIIVGNIDIMSPSDDATDFELAREDIVAACLRGSELTRRLLAFAQVSRIEPGRVSLGELIAREFAADDAGGPDGVEVRTELMDDLWEVFVDPSLLESSLRNFVDNAREAMPSGGVMTVAAANLAADDPRLHPDLPHRPCVMLSVSDTGAGIPSDLIDRVFDPFVSTKKPSVGAGLGLAMVHGFAAQSGGAVSIDSEPGAGTTVRLFLPAAYAGVDSPSATPFTPLAAGERMSARVLLVDDEANFRKIARQVLEGAGLEVVEADSGDEALSIYEQATTPFDVLVTDVVMPGEMQGPDLALELEKRQPDLRVAFVSGYARRPAELSEALRLGDVYLAKPIRADELLAAVAALIAPSQTI